MHWDLCLLAEQEEIPVLWGVWDAIDQYHTGTPTDYELIEAAKTGDFTGDLFEKFCDRYGVLRPPINKTVGRKTRLQAIATVFFNLYGKDRISEPTQDGLAGMWFEAVISVNEILEQEGKIADMCSLCMKALWFYHPLHSTMWDKYAVSGLQQWQKKAKFNKKIKNQHDATCFIHAFENEYKNKKEEICKAIQSIANLRNAAPYPYGRRVLDKALWFKGAKKGEQVRQLEKLLSSGEREDWFRKQLFSMKWWRNELTRICEEWSKELNEWKES